MNGITLHVLNIITGLPARGVPVMLELQTSSRAWRPTGQGRTNDDGRLETLLPQNTRLQPGVYRLTFDVATYFRSLRTTGFYPEVSVVFSVRDVTQHYHIPLLLSPFGYTTYRGN